MIRDEQIELERETVKRALEKHKGNVPAAAKEVGLPLRTLYYRLKKFLNIDPADFR
jgi:transcriptional regulator with PAS, ATPase and Fis domain